MQPQEMNHFISELKENKIEEKDVRKAVGLLSPEQKRKLDDAMNNPETLKKLMNTPKAQELLKKLKDKN